MMAELKFKTIDIKIKLTKDINGMSTHHMQSGVTSCGPCSIMLNNAGYEALNLNTKGPFTVRNRVCVRDCDFFL